MKMIRNRSSGNHSSLTTDWMLALCVVLLCHDRGVTSFHLSLSLSRSLSLWLSSNHLRIGFFVCTSSRVRRVFSNRTICQYSRAKGNDKNQEQCANQYHNARPSLRLTLTAHRLRLGSLLCHGLERGTILFCFCMLAFFLLILHYRFAVHTLYAHMTATTAQVSAHEQHGVDGNDSKAFQSCHVIVWEYSCIHISRSRLNRFK